VSFPRKRESRNREFVDNDASVIEPRGQADLSFAVAQAADTSANQPNTGATTMGTPGAESKGNPIPVPDQANRAPTDEGRSATATTPGEESKGKPAIPPQ
jgi:hypothetical protein